jgi:hypothetical protein
MPFYLQVPFQSVSDALDAVKRGKVWGVVHFAQNFTDELVVRRADGKFADKETILASRVAITLDSSSEYYEIVFFILTHLTFDVFH